MREHSENPATRQNTQVGESRSSLDPRDSDITRRREKNAAELVGLRRWSCVEGAILS